MYIWKTYRFDSEKHNNNQYRVLTKGRTSLCFWLFYQTRLTNNVFRNNKWIKLLVLDIKKVLTLLNDLILIHLYFVYSFTTCIPILYNNFILYQSDITHKQITYNQIHLLTILNYFTEKYTMKREVKIKTNQLKQKHGRKYYIQCSVNDLAWCLWLLCMNISYVYS